MYPEHETRSFQRFPSQHSSLTGLIQSLGYAQHEPHTGGPVTLARSPLSPLLLTITATSRERQRRHRAV